MPIKGLTDRPPRLPRIGKIHLGVKVTTNKKGEPCAPYPRATEYFVYDPSHPQYSELVAMYGEKPTELRILLPVEDETKFASQFYRLYSRTRGLVCKGDGEEALRMVDKTTGALANRDSTEVAMTASVCQGKACPDYGPRGCGEVMNLQFLLPEVSGFGVWQIDTGSVNSIININSALELVRGVYGRVSMVPLILALEPKEVVNPDDGKKKTVRVLNIRSTDKMIEAYRKAQMPPLQLVEAMGETGDIGPIEAEQMPPAGEEPPFGDLPDVSFTGDEAGPGTETDPWPGAPEKTPSADAQELNIVNGVLWISKTAKLPVGGKGMRVGIKETGEVLRWEELEEKAGRWIKDVATTEVTEPAPDEPTKVIPPAAEKEQAADTTPPPGTPGAQAEPWPGMSFNDLLDWVKAHKKTEGWLFKTFGFNVAKAKETPYDCALEVKEMMGW